MVKKEDVTNPVFNGYWSLVIVYLALHKKSFFVIKCIHLNLKRLMEKYRNLKIMCIFKNQILIDLILTFTSLSNTSDFVLKYTYIGNVTADTELTKSKNKPHTLPFFVMTWSYKH